MGYPGGHEPELDHCPTCGGPCAHKDHLIPRNRAKPSAGDAAHLSSTRRGPGRIVDGKRSRVVTYLKMSDYLTLLKLAGGRDMAEVVRELVLTHPAFKEKETES